MKRQRITVAGRSLDVGLVPAAQPDAPALVFLHEGLGSIDLWRGFPERVARATGRRAVVYSRYGNGFSEPLGERRDVSYMHDEARVALPELLDALEIERAALIGHSDGASIALLFAGALPGRTDALVLEAPHVFVEELSIASIAEIGRRYAANGFRERMRKHHTDADRTFRGWNDVWLDPAFRSWTIVDALPRIVAPVLAIQGANDEYGTLAQLDALQRSCSGSVDTLILDKCGHAPHRDRPEVVETFVTAWLLEAKGAS